MGFVFYDRSSRRLGVEQACEIASQLPPFVARIALFLDAESEYVDAVISRFKPDVLQFHGNESPGFCAAFGVPYIKSVPMGSKLSIQDYSARYPGACAVLLDSHTPGAAGGSGQRFDWKRVPRELKKPFILAGGLAPDNVTDALRQVRPFAVDVSSGVEAAPGVKDHALMADFMKEVANGDQA